jgi:hypothetical protein
MQTWKVDGGRREDLLTLAPAWHHLRAAKTSEICFGSGLRLQPHREAIAIVGHLAFGQAKRNVRDFRH